MISQRKTSNAWFLKFQVYYIMLHIKNTAPLELGHALYYCRLVLFNKIIYFKKLAISSNNKVEMAHKSRQKQRIDKT